MARTYRKVWASGLIALLVVSAAMLAPPTAWSQSQRSEVEALQREIEALRQKITTLDTKKEQPQASRKIVVTSPLVTEVAVTQRYAGTIQAQSHIRIRPLVSGYLAEVLVKEGETIKKGDVMFRILPTLYQSRLDVELADVEAAQIEFKFAESLFKKKVVSQDELSLAQVKLAKAQAKAKLARDELSFTTILAPLDGAVGRLQVQAGSLVKEADVLTTLSDNSALRFYFNVPEVRYCEYQAELAKDKAGLQVELVLASGGKLPRSSHVTAVEANSDSIMFRADFPNPERLLLHGQSGQVSVHRSLPNALVIPQRSTLEMGEKRYVYVVGKDDVVHQREIEIQTEMDDIFVINKGLDVNDRIIVDGIRQVHVGEPVNYEFRKPEEILPGVKKHDK